MLVNSVLVALLGLAVAAEASSIHRTPTSARLSRRQTKNGGNNAGQNNAAANPTCLSANAIQTGSQSTGQSGAVAADGQVNSKTDNANFINHCAGKTLTNGLQNKAGSCNGIVMGDIPASTLMVSTVIVNPQNNQEIPEATDFNITANILNLALGSFTNATSTYYAAPQQLDGSGRIIGHTHVTVQDTGNTNNPTTALSPNSFVFFKGINDAGNGNGLVTTKVAGGLKAGNYRVCTLSGSSNHAPVLMPVAQRGAQDDCRYFKVVAGKGGATGTSTSSTAAAAASSAAAGGEKTGGGKGAGVSSSSTAAASSSSAAAGGKKTGGGKGAGARSSSTAAAAASSAAAGGEKTGGGKGAGGASTSSTAAAASSSAAVGSGGKPSKTSSAATTSAAATSTAAGAKATGGATTSKAAAGAALAGIAAPVVQDSGDVTRPFLVNGETFVNKAAAVQRACAIQNNQCADAVNSGKAAGSTVSDCNAQENTCNAAGGA